MTPPTPPQGTERPPPVSDWAARQAEIDAASAADRAAAARSREAAARERERDYDNTGTTWAGIAVVVVIVIVGLFVVFRLIGESRLEDCLLGHRYNCDDMVGP